MKVLEAYSAAVVFLERVGRWSMTSLEWVGRSVTSLEWVGMSVTSLDSVVRLVTSLL